MPSHYFSCDSTADDFVCMAVASSHGLEVSVSLTNAVKSLLIELQVIVLASFFSPEMSSPGGEIDCVDKDGNTPLHVAARYGHELLINTLITNGADAAK